MRCLYWLTGTLAGLTLLATTALPVVARASPTDPFVARFKASKSGLPLGNAVFRLARADQPDCYIYSGDAHPNALVHMFLGNISDESRFCVVDGQIRPRSFRHHIDGKPKKSYTLDFDWSAGQVRYRDEAGRTRVYPIKNRVQDPLSLQIAARRWIAAATDPGRLTTHDFRLADDDGIETYRVALSNGGEIDTPAGRYETLKLARTGRHSDGLTFWLAKNADWLPIKVNKIDDGDTRYSLRLKSLQRGGSPDKTGH